MREHTEPTLSRRNRYTKKPGKRKLPIILLIIFLFLFAGGIYAYIRLDAFLGEITTNTEPIVEGEEIKDEKFTDDPFAMVVLGKDTREETGSLNTDVIIVAVVQPKEKQVTLLSVPRDTRVVIPGYSGYHKVNSAFARGENARKQAERKNEPVTVTGISLVKKTLEGFLGIPIKHYVTIDFEGFIAVIDKLGGIEIDVKKRMVYHDPNDGTNIDLYPGLQILDGKKALDYVRHRHDDRGGKYYSSDFERNERQQEVIKAIVDKMKSFQGVTKIFGVMDVAGDHIRTDFSKDQIKGLALTFRSVGSENIHSLKSEAYWESSVSYTLFPQENLNEIRLALWNAMGMTEEEGKALLDPKNDIPPKKSTKPKEVPQKPEEPKQEPQKQQGQNKGSQGDKAEETQNQDSSKDVGNIDEDKQNPESPSTGPDETGNENSNSEEPSNHNSGTENSDVGNPTAQNSATENNESVESGS